MCEVRGMMLGGAARERGRDCFSRSMTLRRSNLTTERTTNESVCERRGPRSNGFCLSSLSSRIVRARILLLGRHRGSAVLPWRRVAWRRGASLGGQVGVGERASARSMHRAFVNEGAHARPRVNRRLHGHRGCCRGRRRRPGFGRIMMEA